MVQMHLLDLLHTLYHIVLKTITVYLIVKQRALTEGPYLQIAKVLFCFLWLFFLQRLRQI